ncbi:hypothetical protein SEA_NODIGI_71 [Gordonia phage Nodigi]|nr:hypothetical protein SEA_NODIGI_71 [Gordonia phage Nodigi]
MTDMTIPRHVNVTVTPRWGHHYLSDGEHLVVCADIDLPVDIGEVGDNAIPVRVGLEGSLELARVLRTLADKLEESVGC